MCVRSCCLILALLVFLGTGRAASAQHVELFRPGAVELELSPLAVSSLPFDPGFLADSACDPAIPPAPPEGMTRCQIVISPVSDPPPPGGGGRYLKGEVSQGPELLPLVVVRNLHLEGVEDVDSPCGSWNVAMILDPDGEQPVAPLRLEEASEDHGRGVFAGDLEMRTILRLTHRESGRTADFPLRIGMSLAGPWTLDPSGGTPERSNLVLLADRIDGRVVPVDQYTTMKLLEVPAGMEDAVAQDCPICLRGVLPIEGGAPLRR